MRRNLLNNIEEDSKSKTLERPYHVQTRGRRRARQGQSEYPRV